MSEKTSDPPRFLQDHEVYALLLLEEGSFNDPFEAFDHLAKCYLRNSEVCRRIADIIQATPGIQAQADEFIFLVKGPRTVLAPLVLEGILSADIDGDTPEQLGQDLYHLLSTRPHSLASLPAEIEKLTGWSGINPEWVRVQLDDLMQKGLVVCVDDEYVVPVSDDDDEHFAAEPRSARHEELHASAERLGEPACTIIRGLIDEIYGEGPLEN